MSWASAQTEARRRLALLPLPPVKPWPAATGQTDQLPTAEWAGLTVTLIEYETDAVAALVAGGVRADFQRMVNRAMKRELQHHGAQVDVWIIRFDEVIRWHKSMSPEELAKMQAEADRLEAEMRANGTLPPC